MTEARYAYTLMNGGTTGKVLMWLSARRWVDSPPPMTLNVLLDFVVSPPAVAEV